MPASSQQQHNILNEICARFEQNVVNSRQGPKYKKKTKKQTNLNGVENMKGECSFEKFTLNQILRNLLPGSMLS